MLLSRSIDGNRATIRCDYVAQDELPQAGRWKTGFLRNHGYLGVYMRPQQDPWSYVALVRGDARRCEHLMTYNS